MHRSVSTLHPHVGCNKKHPPRCDWKEISAHSELWILVTSRCVQVFYTSIQPINVSFWFWTHSFPMDKYCSMLLKNKSIVYIYIYIYIRGEETNILGAETISTWQCHLHILSIYSFIYLFWWKYCIKWKRFLNGDKRLSTEYVLGFPQIKSQEHFVSTGIPTG